jgi:hypothetical protein
MYGPDGVSARSCTPINTSSHHHVFMMLADD